jgi:hypothetical protein
MKKLPLLLLCIVGLSTASVIAQKAPKVDFAKKIADATPEALPQSPIESGRPSSDAKDDGLKGNVKSVLSYFLDEPKKKTPDSEAYYDEAGNETKHVSYDEGYPVVVIVYGYVDGMRVLRSGDVTYAEGERPESTTIIVKMAPAAGPTADPRYESRIARKYDDQNRLVELIRMNNSGQIWQRQNYSYAGNKRTQITLDRLGQEFSYTVDTLDSHGNPVESVSGREDPYKIVNKYTYDTRGNWTSMAVYEEVAVRGRKTQKHRWTTVRTITYY